MSAYRIYRRNASGRVTNRLDVDCAGDQAALTFAIRSLKPGAEAEVWDGEAFIGAAALPPRGKMGGAVAARHGA